MLNFGAKPLYDTEYGMIRKDKIRSGYIGNIESVIHNADVQNGQFFTVGDLAYPSQQERELRTLEVPATANLGPDQHKRLFIAGTPETLYFPGQTIKDFVNKAGTPIEAYAMEPGDIITISTNVIDNSDETPGVDYTKYYVMPQDGSMNLTTSATLPTTTKFVGKIIEVTDIYQGYRAFAIECISN